MPEDIFSHDAARLMIWDLSANLDYLETEYVSHELVVLYVLLINKFSKTEATIFVSFFQSISIFGPYES